MSLDTEILQTTKREVGWKAELEILRCIMDGTTGTNAQRNALRRIIRQHAAVLNQSTPAQTFAALRKIGEITRIPNITGNAQPKLVLGQFINPRTTQ
jgi:hypothetical protein